MGSAQLITEGNTKGLHAGITYKRGDVIQRFEYAAYGRESFALNPNLSWDPAFTGQQYDIETGLYYYRARYYNPILGRFIQPDTVVQDRLDLQSWNRYAYVRNNPLKYVDPTGHEPHFDMPDDYDHFVHGRDRDNDHDFSFTDNGNLVGEAVSQNSYFGALTGTNISGPFNFSSGFSGLNSTIGLGNDVLNLVHGAGSLALAGVSALSALVSVTGCDEMCQLATMAVLQPQIAAAAAGLEFLGPWLGSSNTGRVFWSGSESAKNAANNFAKANGLTTLEMTKAGQNLIGKTKGMPWSQAGPLWQELSGEFAKGASGQVNVFQSAEGVSLNSIWRSVEYPALQVKENVEIIYHTIFEK